ncbi:unnamed protein product [Symbiodinium necroappetens]|uniref:Uncharacterized protein n=1 Tax=Symbiodinium necroappetens TaxID=1628268 RepID=A0A812X2U3_9DINO|nr:unnamed protein product [Symbiodinium necroappetens]
MKQVGSHGSQYGRRESGPSVSDQDWAEQEAGLDPSGPPVLRASVAGDAGRVCAPQRLQASARAVRNLFLCVCSKDDAADDEPLRPSVEQRRFDALSRPEARHLAGRTAARTFAQSRRLVVAVAALRPASLAFFRLWRRSPEALPLSYALGQQVCLPHR